MTLNLVSWWGTQLTDFYFLPESRFSPYRDGRPTIHECRCVPWDSRDWYEFHATGGRNAD